MSKPTVSVVVDKTNMNNNSNINNNSTTTTTTSDGDAYEWVCDWMNTGPLVVWRQKKNQPVTDKKWFDRPGTPPVPCKMYQMNGTSWRSEDWDPSLDAEADMFVSQQPKGSAKNRPSGLFLVQQQAEKVAYTEAEMRIPSDTDLTDVDEDLIKATKKAATHAANNNDKNSNPRGGGSSSTTWDRSSSGNHSNSRTGGSSNTAVDNNSDTIGTALDKPSLWLACCPDVRDNSLVVYVTNRHHDEFCGEENHKPPGPWKKYFGGNLITNGGNWDHSNDEAADKLIAQCFPCCGYDVVYTESGFECHGRAVGHDNHWYMIEPAQGSEPKLIDPIFVQRRQDMTEMPATNEAVALDNDNNNNNSPDPLPYGPGTQQDTPEAQVELEKLWAEYKEKEAAIRANLASKNNTAQTTQNTPSENQDRPAARNLLEDFRAPPAIAEQRPVMPWAVGGRKKSMHGNDDDDDDDEAVSGGNNNDNKDSRVESSSKNDIVYPQNPTHSELIQIIKNHKPPSKEFDYDIWNPPNRHLFMAGRSKIVAQVGAQLVLVLMSRTLNPRTYRLIPPPDEQAQVQAVEAVLSSLLHGRNPVVTGSGRIRLDENGAKRLSYDEDDKGNGPFEPLMTEKHFAKVVHTCTNIFLGSPHIATVWKVWDKKRDLTGCEYDDDYDDRRFHGRFAFDYTGAKEDDKKTDKLGHVMLRMHEMTMQGQREQREANLQAQREQREGILQLNEANSQVHREEREANLQAQREQREGILQLNEANSQVHREEREANAQAQHANLQVQHAQLAEMAAQRISHQEQMTVVADRHQEQLNGVLDRMFGLFGNAPTPLRLGQGTGQAAAAIEAQATVSSLATTTQNHRRTPGTNHRRRASTATQTPRRTRAAPRTPPSAPIQQLDSDRFPHCGKDVVYQVGEISYHGRAVGHTPKKFYKILPDHGGNLENVIPDLVRPR